MKDDMKSSLRFLASVVVLGIISFAFSAGVLATKPNQVPNPDVSRARRTFSLPESAKQVAPGVFSLGKAMDGEKEVEGYAIVDYKKGQGKPSGCNEDGVCQGWEDATCSDCEQGSDMGDSDCFGFLAKGAKWRALEPYIVDPENARGVSGGFIRENLALDIDKWEDAADGLVDSKVEHDILGNEIAGTVDGADTQTPDNQNEVYFADIEDEGAIAVTIVWGVFTGPPFARELVEWDQIYDEVDYDWSADGEDGKMDFESIATHELGHSCGLDDLYQDSCWLETMYGYASLGETKKRDLSEGDITGISTLYQ